MSAKDLTGARFGRLVPFARATENTRHGGARWRCQCDCGNETVVSAVNLRNSTLSCGCLKTEQNRALFRKASGYSGLTHLIGTYRCSARVRGHPFALTREEFQALTQRACHYCGTEPLRAAINPKQKGASESATHSAYLYNGLDRIDNSQGYVSDNVVPCCWPCNELKGKMTAPDFLRQVLAVASWQARRTS